MSHCTNNNKNSNKKKNEYIFQSDLKNSIFEPVCGHLDLGLMTS